MRLLLVGLHLDIVETLKLLLEFVLSLIILLLQRYLSVLPDRLPLILVVPELTLRLCDVFDQASATDPLLHAATAHLTAIDLGQLQKRQLALILGAPVQGWEHFCRLSCNQGAMIVPSLGL